MRIRIPDAAARIHTRPHDLRPVVLDICGLEIALTRREAFKLADKIVDAAERIPRP